MKRIKLAAVSVMALFLLTLGARNASADTFYCVANSGTGCSTTQPALGTTYWTVTNSLTATPNGTNTGGTFSDTFTVAGSSTAGSYLTSFSLTEFSGSVVATPTMTTNTGWNDIEVGKTNGGAGSCTGNDSKAFCASDAFGGTPFSLLSATATFTITGSYTGTVLSPYDLQLFSATNSNGTGGNVLAISQDSLGHSVPVPDGGMTVMLLGGALVGLEALRRRVRA